MKRHVGWRCSLWLKLQICFHRNPNNKRDIEAILDLLALCGFWDCRFCELSVREQPGQKKRTEPDVVWCCLEPSNHCESIVLIMYASNVVWMLHTANDVTFARLRLNLLPFLRVNYSRSVWLMGSVATPKASPCTCYLTAAGAILWQKRRSQHWEQGAASKTSWSCKGFWIPMSMLIVLRCTQHRQVCDSPTRQAKEDFAITLPWLVRGAVCHWDVAFSFLLPWLLRLAV